MASGIFRETIVPVLFACLVTEMGNAQTTWEVTSPDGHVAISVKMTQPDRAIYPVPGARLYYEARHDGTVVLPLSPLGIGRMDQNFVDDLRLVDAGAVKTIDEKYTMLTGKRRDCRSYAKEQTLTFQNPNGAKVELIVRAYNDGVAFRYRFPESSSEKYVVTSEATGFHLPEGRQGLGPAVRQARQVHAGV